MVEMKETLNIELRPQFIASGQRERMPMPSNNLQRQYGRSTQRSLLRDTSTQYSQVHCQQAEQLRCLLVRRTADVAWVTCH
jgi:hypothetical protein